MTFCISTFCTSRFTTCCGDHLRTRCGGLLLLAVLVGCSSSEYELAPVSGTVTLDGEPVAKARVIFEPKRTGQEALSAGPSSNGLTDDNGRYQLQTTVEGHDGAVVGMHTVTVSTYLAEVDRTRDTARVLRQEEIPSKYREPGTLTFDVPSGGTEVADFSLAK